MYKLDDLKPIRKMWVKMANIPTGRLGWVLDDCTEVRDKNMAKIRHWVNRVQNSEIIKASGEADCGKGLLRQHCLFLSFKR
jgi:CRISPR/Cas system CMR subunit Cmr4 (Cas7 group RAMP superfamily)